MTDPGSGPARTPAGAVAPDYRAPSNKGHTLGPDSFADRLAVVLVFVDEWPGADVLAAHDEALVEFGSRRVQLLGVAPVAPSRLRDEAGDLTLTVLADEDGSIREAFGPRGPATDGWFAVVVDRAGRVAEVLGDEDARAPAAVLADLDRLLEDRPDAMTPPT